MNLQQLQQELAQGEGMHTEFKRAWAELPRNLFESVCAFLNTDGGMILLGVSDEGEITGVDPDAVGRLKAQLASLSNNPQKIDPPYLLFPHEFEIDGKLIIAAQIPLSSQLHKTGGEIFLRSEDGDYRAQGTHQLAGLINRKLGLFTEQRPLPNLSMSDLRPELFDHARRLMHSYNSKHPWAKLSNEELLHIGGFYAHNEHTGEQKLTLAAVLMFGTDIAIQQAVPAYKFDCLLRRENEDRYDDRVMIYTNLMDAYDQMMDFIEKHLNDPFYLEGDMRMSLRDKIFREAVSNIVSHREYTSPAPARLIIYKDQVILDNPTVQHHFEEITPANLRPFSKNPTLAKFMIQLGRFDELGSGVTNINKYLPLYAHGSKPTFKESPHTFELTIPLGTPDQANPKKGTKWAPSRHQVNILHKCLKESSIGELMAVDGRTDRTKFRNQVLTPLLQENLVEMTQPDSPRSPTQKYRLTATGKKLLEDS